MIARVAALACVACTSATEPPPPTTQTCSLELSGNFVATATTTTACASIASDDAGGRTFVVDASSPTTGRVQATISLGASPTAGHYSSDGVDAWSSSSVGTSDGSCAFAAGADTVPHGSFTLDLAPSDAGPIHGALTVVMTVQAAPQANCGAGDVEYVHVGF